MSEQNLRLSPGSKAPDFELESVRGGRCRLGDLLSTGLILYFYPKDDTPGCTVQAQGFETHREALAELGYKVVGISRDLRPKHEAFCEKYGLSFDLLSDPTTEVHQAYGAWGEKSLYGKLSVGVIRSTFVLGADGVLQAAFYNVRAKGHVESLLTKLPKLQAA